MVIPGRFNGPSGSGNGGYSAGMFAGLVDGVAEVTLRMPPPLDTPLTARGGEVLSPSGRVVATVAAVAPFPVAVEPVPLPVAAEAARHYPGFTEHPFPTCYVCGPERDDGLAIFPGPLDGGGVAAPFTAPVEVTPQTVWAALDCPGGWSVISAGRPFVLGRIAAVVSALPEPGAEHVVVGRMSEREGRKATVDSALYTAGGTLLAHAHATWIAI